MKEFPRFIRIALLLLALSLLSGCVVVEDGTIGVSKSMGKISEQQLSPGVYWNVPLLREVEVWNVKTQRLTRKLDIPSGEGLIVGIETALLFRPENVIDLRIKVGPQYVLTVLESTLINVFREVIGKERVEDLIKNQEVLTGRVAAILTEQMKDRGIVVEELLVTGLRLPDKVKAAIERKIEEEQRAMQKEFELQQAKKDAEIKIVRAEAQSRHQEIVRSTLSSEYLQYLWITELNQNPNVIYVATEANMPIFKGVAESPRASTKESSAKTRSSGTAPPAASSNSQS